MLRITRTAEAHPTMLRVEGKLTTREVDEIARVCGTHVDAADEVVLDFSSVTFIDAAAAAALRDLMRRKVRLRGCSPLISTLLKEPQT